VYVTDNSDRPHLGTIIATACCLMEFVPLGRGPYSQAKARPSVPFD